MISVKVTIQDLTRNLVAAVDRAAFKSFRQAAYAIMQTAKGSLSQQEGPSPAGSPPHTHKGRWLARAVQYNADREGAVIGPVKSFVGDVGTAHEFGGMFRGDKYPERPFMQPALKANLSRFASEWSGSISD